MSRAVSSGGHLFESHVHRIDLLRYGCTGFDSSGAARGPGWLRAHASVFSEVRAARAEHETTRVSMLVHDEMVQIMATIAMSTMPISPAVAVAGP